MPRVPPPGQLLIMKGARSNWRCRGKIAASCNTYRCAQPELEAFETVNSKLLIDRREKPSQPQHGSTSQPHSRCKETCRMMAAKSCNCIAIATVVACERCG